MHESYATGHGRGRVYAPERDVKKSTVTVAPLGYGARRSEMTRMIGSTGQEATPTSSRHGRRAVAIAVGLVLGLVPAHAAQARLGDLDPSFDGDGIAAPAVGATDAAGARFEAVTTRGDGRPVAAGWARNQQGIDEALVVQLTNSGELDPAWGAPPRASRGSRAAGSSRTCARSRSTARAGCSPPATAAPRRLPPPGAPFALRLTPGGANDDTFASSLGAQPGEAHAVIPLPDGKLLVGGWRRTGCGARAGRLLRRPPLEHRGARHDVRHPRQRRGGLRRQRARRSDGRRARRQHRARRLGRGTERRAAAARTGARRLRRRGRAGLELRRRRPADARRRGPERRAARRPESTAQGASPPPASPGAARWSFAVSPAARRTPASAPAAPPMARCRTSRRSTLSRSTAPARWSPARRASAAARRSCCWAGSTRPAHPRPGSAERLPAGAASRRRPAATRGRSAPRRDRAAASTPPGCSARHRSRSSRATPRTRRRPPRSTRPRRCSWASRRRSTRAARPIPRASS